MLIYNYKKEFLGIDELDLQALGFKNLSGLQTEVSDFSDLFVKTPGYIHNFKHVHWIDFITCADSTEPPKAIIHAKGVNYKTNLKITTAYLSDNPAEKAYLVTLQNLRRLTDSENTTIASDLAHKQAQFTAPTASLDAFDHFEPSPAEPIQHTFEKIQTKPEVYEAPSRSDVVEDVYDDLPLEINMDEEEELVAIAEVNEVPAVAAHVETPKTTIQTKAAVVHPPKVTEEQEYIFDPHVASKELGLPVDLIEEFIQDFIAQAKEFKDDLYVSLRELDLTNVKILSHKLKGVAANLRVADALEALTLVNTSSDFPVIHSNLDRFYRIISKLSGEAPTSEPISTTNARSEEDEFVVEFKDHKDDLDIPLELSDIDDNDVPDAIEMPELADDDFTPSEIQDISADNLDIDFDVLDVDELTLELTDINELPDELDAFADEEEIKPVTLLQTQEKSSVKITYKPQLIANEIGIDLESFYELFDDFLHEGQLKSKQIRDAVNHENSQLWKVKAMKLKGMSENMRIKELSHELDAIISTTDSQEALDSINKIDAMMSQISQKEA